MNALDILLWLLIALLAGLAYAIEAGAVQQHKKVVVSTMFTVLLAVLYLLFFVEDKTKMTLDPYVEAKKKGGGKKSGGMAGGGGESKKQEREGADDQGNGRDEEDGGGDGAPSEQAAATPDSKLEKFFSDCDVCPSMVRIPVGRFRMGAPEGEPGRQPNEGPPKTVAIMREFASSRFEITRSDFNHFVKETGYEAPADCITGPKKTPKANWRNPGFEQSPTHPVVCLTIYDALAYTQWLTQKSGKRYRLPSESEWEYVARAGTTTAYAVGDQISGREANFARARDGTTPVGFSGANLFGVYEMHGNAAELVADCWADDLLDIPEEGSPHQSFSNCRRGVIRGGSWQSPAWEARSASRRVLGSDVMPLNTVGFRVVRDLDLDPSKVGEAVEPEPVPVRPTAPAAAPKAAQSTRIDRSADHLE